jgi:hypothetical protein
VLLTGINPKIVQVLVFQKALVTHQVKQLAGSPHDLNVQRSPNQKFNQSVIVGKLWDTIHCREMAASSRVMDQLHANDFFLDYLRSQTELGKRKKLGQVDVNI